MIEIEKKILSVLAKVLEMNIEDIPHNAAMNKTFGWDSLATVNFIVELEDVFDVEIALDDAEKLVSVKAAIEYFKRT